MKCELLEGCIFFNDKMDIESGLGKLYKQRYCEGDNTTCARYIVASKIGRQHVPVNLYPNMHEQAEEILKEHGK